MTNYPNNIDRVYLDHNATTPMLPEVREAMLKGIDLFGNPSSSHALGREASDALHDARVRIAQWMGAEPNELLFTASGSEASNTAIKGVAFALREARGHIVTSRIEHSCVLEACRYLGRMGFEITYLPVDASGRVDPAAVYANLRTDTRLIAIMHANNETGMIQPTEEIGAIALEKGVPFFADGVQTAGKLDFRFRALPVQLMSASAHKLYGPKGVGVLAIRNGMKLEPLMHGGGQEAGRRAGTENLPGVLGLAAACSRLHPFPAIEMERQRELRDKLWRRLEAIDDVRLNGDLRYLLPGTLNVSFGYVRSDALVLALDLEKIAVSAGSACHSTRAKASHVLEAMGVSGHWLFGAIRFSLGKSTTAEQIEHVANVVERTVRRLRAMLPVRRSVPQLSNEEPRAVPA